MKTLKLTFIGLVLFLSSALKAQVSINVNFGSPPMWGPVGYTEVRYYYIPDVEAYYDIQLATFIYFDDGIWIHRAYLPSRYRNYDLYGGYKVVITDYYGNSPYVHFKQHKTKYYKGYHNGSQKTIGDRPGKENYKVNKNPNDHSKKREIKGNNKTIYRNNNQSKKSPNQGHENGKGKGSGGGHGKKK